MPPYYTHFLLIMVSSGNSFRFSRHEIMHYEKKMFWAREMDRRVRILALVENL